MFKHLQDCKWAGSMDVGDNPEEVEIVQGFSNEELNNEFPELWENCKKKMFFELPSV